MKTLPKALITLAAVATLAASARGNVIVNDTWLDGTRTDPAQPTYSENGTDIDVDGDIESVWYRGGGGTLDPVGAGGPLRGTVDAASSSSWTTYFTPEASPITLANPGDALKLTWVFTPTTIDTTNAGQSFRLAIANSPSGSWLTADGSPGNATYAGYAMFMNMSTTLSNSNPFQLRERSDPGTASAFLSSSGSWTGLANDGAVGQVGYASGTQYTFVFEATRSASDGLDFDVSMSGGSIGDDGTLQILYTDTTPNGGSFSFNTFGLRPSRADQSAAQFDTSRFKVEYIPVPEPTTLALLLAGAGLAGLPVLRRRGRA